MTVLAQLSSGINLSRFDLSASAFLPRATLAFCFALLVLLIFDRRKLALPAAIILSVLFAASSIWLGWRNVPALAAWFFFFSAACGLATFVIALRQWLVSSPTERFEEDVVVAASKRKKKPPKRRRAKQKVSPQTTAKRLVLSGSFWIASIGFIAALVGLSLQIHELPPLVLAKAIGKNSLVVFAVLHCGLVSALLGLTLVITLQLTYLSSPDVIIVDESATRTNRGPHWSSISWLTLAIAGAAVLVAFRALLPSELFFSDQISQLASGGESELSRRATVVVFAITLCVVYFTAWMIPHRLTLIQTKRISGGWVSLTLASWFVLLALVTMLAIPCDWPWRDVF